MIHAVKRLPRAHERLGRVVELQLAILERAAETNKITLDGICGTIRKSQGLSLDDGKALANWLRQTRRIQAIDAFAQGAQEDKRAFVCQARHDVELLYAPKSDQLRLALVKNGGQWPYSAPWLQGAKTFLDSSYKCWCDSGFDARLVGCPCERKYARDDFVREFTECNGNLHVCAICDAIGYRTQTGERDYVAIEHFFPRSIYPHLACHPLNLIPICSPCNSWIKGDSDPFGDGGISTIDELLLPYQEQSAASLAYVQFDRNEVDRAKHPLAISLRRADGVEEGVDGRLDAFEKLYRVQERWSESLDVIGDKVFRRLLQFLFLDIAQGTSLENVPLLRQKLNMLMAITEAQDLGKDPYAYIIVWHLKHFVDELDRDGCKAPIYMVIRDWTQERSGAWEELWERADAIRRRDPRSHAGSTGLADLSG